MQQHGSKYFTRKKPHPKCVLKSQNSTFSEYGCVSYQIKGNDTCNNMVVNSLPTNPSADPLPSPPPPRHWGLCQKVKIQFFQDMVMLHFKLKGITYAANW